MASAGLLTETREQGTLEACFAKEDACSLEEGCADEPNVELESKAGGGDAADADAPRMSKNQLKKLRRKERTEVKNAYKRIKEKEKKKAVSEERKKAAREMLAGLSKEEVHLELHRRKEGRIQRVREKQQKKARQREALKAGSDLVIDLEFGDLMKPEERKSLMQQLMYCYNRNSQAQRPFRLCLTGVTGTMKEQVHNICGFQNWLVVSEERSYLERFADRKSDLVYLTADAEETIQELDAEKVYIIGGIVDRNRHKGLTYNKAKEQGIAMAKLPIGDHLRLASSKVLTVNHVLELLVQYNELKDWQKALDLVVPTRKRAGEEQDRQGTRPRVEPGEGMADRSGEKGSVKDEDEEGRELLPSEGGAEQQDEGNEMRTGPESGSLPVEGALRSTPPLLEKEGETIATLPSEHTPAVVQ